jgi:hypothetical protein
MERIFLSISALLAITLSIVASAERISVRHIQSPLHRSMVTRSGAGKIIATDEFSQVMQGNEVMMRLTYRFVDGSIDDESTTFTQQGTFQLVRDHHLQEGPFFAKPVDFTVEVTNGTATSCTAGENGKIHVESRHIDLPDDLANGIVGTLLLNLPNNTAPIRVGLLAPIDGGRLIRILISPEGEQSFHMAGQNHRAMVFRIHPELGGILGVIAPLIGVQPKDVIVWVMEGEEPAVVKIVGQLGGYGPVVTSLLEGTSFGQ